MEINKELVKHVAKVARLELSEKELDKLTPQLNDILVFFGELGNNDPDEISFHPIEIRDSLREDVIEKTESKEGYIKGPSVI